jgi:hypothetical protein
MTLLPHPLVGGGFPSPVAPGTGNVLEARPQDDRLRGQQGSAVVGVLRNLRRRVGRR